MLRRELTAALDLSTSSVTKLRRELGEPQERVTLLTEYLPACCRMRAGGCA